MNEWSWYNHIIVHQFLRKHRMSQFFQLKCFEGLQDSQSFPRILYFRTRYPAESKLPSRYLQLSQDCHKLGYCRYTVTATKLVSNLVNPTSGINWGNRPSMEETPLLYIVVISVCILRSEIPPELSSGFMMKCATWWNCKKIEWFI